MAKKETVQILRPSNCIKSLEEFNIRVLALTQTINSTLPFIEKVDPVVFKFINEANEAVKEFYTDQP